MSFLTLNKLKTIGQCPLNCIVNADCLLAMKYIADKSIDCILTDLPYGITSCAWDTVIPFEPLWKQYKRIIKDTGAIVLTACQPFTSLLVMSAKELFKYQWVWKKNVPARFLSIKTQPMQVHEDILIFSKGTIAPGHLNTNNMNYHPQNLIKSNKVFVTGHVPGHLSRHKLVETAYRQEFTNYPKSILEFSLDSKRKHPTQKPVALFEYLIKTYTNVGDLVLDSCAGSGTTGLACLNTNRNFILIEKELKYCNVIKNRLGTYRLTWQYDKSDI